MDHPEHVAVAVIGDVADVVAQVAQVAQEIKVAQETKVDVGAAIAAEAVVPGANGHRSEKIQASKNA